MCRLADIEIDILVRKNEALKDEVCKLRTENDDLVYKLQGVMWSVDKWLDGKEFEQDEVNRAATMREKTLQITEQQQAEIEQWKEEANKYQNWWCEAVGDIRYAKSEAIREFAARLKLDTQKLLKVGEYWDLLHCIDNLVKEMRENEGKE